MKKFIPLVAFVIICNCLLSQRILSSNDVHFVLNLPDLISEECSIAKYEEKDGWRLEKCISDTIFVSRDTLKKYELLAFFAPKRKPIFLLKDLYYFYPFSYSQNPIITRVSRDYFRLDWPTVDNVNLDLIVLSEKNSSRTPGETVIEDYIETSIDAFNGVAYDNSLGYEIITTNIDHHSLDSSTLTKVLNKNPHRPYSGGIDELIDSIGITDRVETNTKNKIITAIFLNIDSTRIETSYSIKNKLALIIGNMGDEFDLIHEISHFADLTKSNVTLNDDPFPILVDSIDISSNIMSTQTIYSRCEILAKQLLSYEDLKLIHLSSKNDSSPGNNTCFFYHPTLKQSQINRPEPAFIYYILNNRQFSKELEIQKNIFNNYDELEEFGRLNNLRIQDNTSIGNVMPRLVKNHSKYVLDNENIQSKSLINYLENNYDRLLKTGIKILYYSVAPQLNEKEKSHLKKGYKGFNQKE